jgi:hypothetical protein
VGAVVGDLWRVTEAPLGTWEFAMSDLSHAVGHDAEGAWTVTPEESGEGFLCRGPSITTLPGEELLVHFDLRLEESASEETTVAVLDVYDATVGASTVSRTLTAADFAEVGVSQRFGLTYTQVEGNMTEFRVHWEGNVALAAEGVLVVEDPRPGYLSYGPAVATLASGSHHGVFTLAIDDINSDDLPVATLDVYDATTSTVLAEGVITRREFAAVDVMQAFYLPYVQQAGHSTEFRVFWSGKSALTLKEVGALQGTLASGASCQPECGAGYTPSRASACLDGTFTAAVCLSE